MNTYPRLMRVAAIVALCSLGLVVSSNGASATSLRTKDAPSHLTSATPPPPGPSGCNGGYFCTYNEGNGGDLCEQMNATGNLAAGCSGQNDSGFNNSSVGVSLYAGINEGGAYYYLGSSDYLLYETQNHFNQCTGGGTSCGDYGGEIYDHLQSVQFQ